MNKFSKFLLIAVTAAFVPLVVSELVLHVVAPVSMDVPTRIVFNNKIEGFQSSITFEVGRDLLRRYDWTNGGSGGSGGKPEGVVRVVCLGGPGTVGVLQNVEQTWWGQLRQQLQQANPETVYQFGALAVEGKGIRFGAKWANTYLKSFHPDLVIAQYGIEDVLLHPEGYRYDPDGDADVVVRRERTGWRGALLGGSQLARRVSRSRQEAHQSRERERYAKPGFYAEQLDLNRELYQSLELQFSVSRLEGADPVEEYKQGLQGIVKAARDADAKILLVGEPSLCGEFMALSARSRLMMPVTVNSPSGPTLRKPEPGWVERELFRYYQQARVYAVDARVPFVELQAVIPQDEYHFFSEAILTDKGAAEVAGRLLPDVQKLMQTP